MKEKIWLDKVIALKAKDKKWPEIAKELQSYFPEGLELTKIIDRIRKAYYKTPFYQCNIPEDEYKESFGIDENGNAYSDKLIKICEGEKLTPERILELHGLVPTNRWKIISYRNNYWHSQIAGGTRLLMYQSKLTAKPVDQALDLKAIEEHFKKLDRKYKTPLPHIQLKKTGQSQMAEVNIADLHLGKVYYDDVNKQLLNSETTQKDWYQLVESIYEDLKNKPLEYITFVWCNDFFNSDTITKTTTAGTPQDTDLPWDLLFQLGVELLIYAIEKFKTIAPVHTFYTASNHDTVNSFHALMYLKAWFRKDSDVVIQSDTYPRKYILYGNTLIGYTHGEKMLNSKASKDKVSKLSALMPVEAADLWAQSKYREIHTAHLHSEHAIEELNGVVVRRISSPTFLDSWHINNGFVGSIRKAQTFIYDKEYGLTSIINTPLK